MIIIHEVFLIPIANSMGKKEKKKLNKSKVSKNGGNRNSTIFGREELSERAAGERKTFS